MVAGRQDCARAGTRVHSKCPQVHVAARCALVQVQVQVARWCRCERGGASASGALVRAAQAPILTFPQRGKAPPASQSVGQDAMRISFTAQEG